MKLIETPIKDLYIIEPSVFNDERGYFFESYNQNQFKKNGLEYSFVQDNQSFSSYGTIRGLHLQTGEFAQAKLVRCTMGRVLDVAIDLRPGSETFGKSFSVELSQDNHRQLLIPRYFAHGFSVLSKEALFQYKCDNFYNKESERGVIYNDPELAIDWQVNEEDACLSSKDLILPSFKEYRETL